MTYEQTGSLAIRLEDAGEVIWARPRPEDENQLAQLLGGGPIAVSLRSGEGGEQDTQGHALGTDVLVDVEGHALTLRLPSPADAELLRRRLMTGAMVATLVVAGAGAGAAIQSMSVPAGNTIAAPQAQPGPASDLAIRREARLAEAEAIPPAVNVAPAAQAPGVQAPGVQAPNAATTAAASQAAQAADVGLADQSAQQAAETFAGSAGAGSQGETPDRHAGSGGPQEVDR